MLIEAEIRLNQRDPAEYVKARVVNSKSRPVIVADFQYGTLFPSIV